MRAITYLVRKEIKNEIIDLIYHPAKLMMYLVIVGMLVFTLLTGTGHETQSSYLDLRILHGIYMAVLLFIAVTSVLGGLKSGASFFKMSDVNFLFVSPISPKRILVYGIIKQMASSLFMMIFLMFYSGMTINAFGVSLWQVFALVGGVALMVFTIQQITLLVYSFSSGKPKRANWVKAVLYAIVAVTAAVALGIFFEKGSTLEALYAAIASPYLEFIPVAGWIKGFIFGIIDGNVPRIVVFMTLNALTILSSIILFMKSDSDYYEDVLETTESAFEIKEAVKSGRTAHVRGRETKPAKVKDTGIRHGWGANTFFFKHIREMKRRNSMGFLRTSNLVLLALNIIMVIVLKNVTANGGEILPADYLMGTALCMSSYILFFFNAAGDWALELRSPYIYLVPEKPFAKLFWASLSTILTPIMDGVLVFTVLCMFLKGNPATAVICMLMYASMGFLYTAGSVLSQRIFGQIVSKGLLMLFYMLMLGVLLAPGIGASIAVFTMVNQAPAFLIGLPAFVYNVLISVGIFAACRNVLSSSEMNT